MGNPYHDNAGRFASKGGGSRAVARAGGSRSIARTAGGGVHAAATGQAHVKRRLTLFPDKAKHPVLHAVARTIQVSQGIKHAPFFIATAVLGLQVGSDAAVTADLARLARKDAARAAAKRTATGLGSHAAEATVRRAALSARGGSIPYASRSRRGAYKVTTL